MKKFVFIFLFFVFINAAELQQLQKEKSELIEICNKSEIRKSCYAEFFGSHMRCMDKNRFLKRLDDREQNQLNCFKIYNQALRRCIEKYQNK